MLWAENSGTERAFKYSFVLFSAGREKSEKLRATRDFLLFCVGAAGCWTGAVYVFMQYKKCTELSYDPGGALSRVGLRWRTVDDSNHSRGDMIGGRLWKRGR